jgi:hypothetical protein
MIQKGLEICPIVRRGSGPVSAANATLGPAAHRMCAPFGMWLGSPGRSMYADRRQDRLQSGEDQMSAPGSRRRAPRDAVGGRCCPDCGAVPGCGGIADRTRPLPGGPDLLGRHHAGPGVHHDQRSSVRGGRRCRVVAVAGSMAAGPDGVAGAAGDPARGTGDRAVPGAHGAVGCAQRNGSPWPPPTS